MTATDRNIIETYSRLLEGLKISSKIELLENLTKSLENEVILEDTEFYKSFGAFDSEKSPQEIIKEIKEHRKFRDKDLNF